jgi:hypothetical protein
MSRGPWKNKPAKEAERLIELAEARGYAVTLIEISDGTIRVGVRRADTVASDDSPEELRKKL